MMFNSQKYNLFLVSISNAQPEYYFNLLIFGNDYNNQFMNKKVILMILDGWGKSPDPKVSAIDNANTQFIDALYTKYGHAMLRTDGLHVGLPEGQMGNSEVGHINLGAGRIVYQDLAKINLAVSNDTLRKERVLKEALSYAKKNQKAVHLLG